MSKEQTLLIQLALRWIRHTTAPEVLSGLQNKARFNLTDAASLEVAKKDGGTIESLRRDLLAGSRNNSTVVEYDFETGKPVSPRNVLQMKDVT